MSAPRRHRIEVRGTLHLDASDTPVHVRSLVLPRDGAGQRVLTSALHITPRPQDFTVHVDLAGHTTIHSRIASPGPLLSLEAHAEVTLARRGGPASGPHMPWEQAVASVRRVRATGKADHGESSHSVVGIVEAALPTTKVDDHDAVITWARTCAVPGMSVVELAHRMSDWVAREIADDAHDSGERTPAASEVLQAGTGTTPGRAHLLCAGLRSLGLAARYVSGALIPEESGLSASGGFHAWTAVWVPGGGWITIDPTPPPAREGTWRHVVMAWGRDGDDVAPVRVAGAPAPRCEWVVSSTST